MKEIKTKFKRLEKKSLEPVGSPRTGRYITEDLIYSYISQIGSMDPRAEFISRPI